MKGHVGVLFLLLSACARRHEITREQPHPPDTAHDSRADASQRPNARLVVDGNRMKAFGATQEQLEKALRGTGISVVTPTDPAKPTAGGAFEIWLYIPPGKPLGDVGTSFRVFRGATAPQARRK